MNEKPFSAACERNQSYILEQLKIILASARNVLEIGTGTGQHAVFFAKALPHIQWQTSDLDFMHQGIKRWLYEANLPNVLSPISLDVNKDTILENYYDGVFTANTFHIMPMASVERCIKQVGHALKEEGVFIIYGPFKFNGKFTSSSNTDFDALLKSQQVHQGIRDFEVIDTIAHSVQLSHIQTIEMPANNFMLIFNKVKTGD
ncbi:MAG: DUF938 domain-containing protein [Proteobacteria bacterium]|nr:DUF938 domain-containing protein [Pseudomonadota bacterium]